MRKRAKEMWHKMTNENATAREVADGVAIGVFVAFSPLLGLHTPLVIGLSVLLRANKWAALFASWICNPITIIPMFLFNYWVGVQLYSSRITMEEMRSLLLNLSFQNLTSLGVDVLIPLCLGSTLVGAVSAWIFRHLTLRFYTPIHKKWMKEQASHNETTPMDAP